MNFGFLIEAFYKSDPVGQAIVGVLLVANCICWTIVLSKRFETSSIVSQCRKFLAVFRKYKFSAPLRIFGELDTNKKVTGPLAALTKAVRETLVATLKLDSIQKAKLLEEGVLPRPLKQSELDALRAAGNREMTEQVIRLESGLTMMTTIISLAPMLGLFGTVWGVLATFIDIGHSGRPDIATVGPGIASALLTTVSGLFVAIPAIFANNFSVRAINDIINNLELYSEDLFSALLTASEAAAQEAAEKEPPATSPAPTVIVQTVAPPPVAPAPVVAPPPAPSPSPASPFSAPADYDAPPAPGYYEVPPPQEYDAPLPEPEPPPRQVQRPVPPPPGL